MKDFIVAIELGSAKITGIAGKKNADGSLNVLAIAEEDSSSCIRKGMVYNLDKTSLCLTNILKKLRQTLKSEIAMVYVGASGQSIHCEKNVIARQLPDDTIITQDMINDIMDNNRAMVYPDMEILDAITQEYRVGAQLQADPIGIQAKKLEGNFLNILQRKTYYRNLNQCFDKAGINIAEMYLAPMAMAESVLTENEMRGGCVLVDLGAETTTVQVYYKNILRHLAVIPLGGNNITKDIASLSMEEADAERMKLEYASAYTDIEDIEENGTYKVKEDVTISSKVFIECVEARVQEIIENVSMQIPQEYRNRTLLGGLILTGGGSNMKDIKKAFRNHTKIEKVRIANTVKQTVTSSIPEINAQDGTMNTALGLLAKGDMNCAGTPVNRMGDRDLFSSNDPQRGSQEIRSEGPKQPGVILSPEERAAIEAKRIREQEIAAEAAAAKAAATANTEATVSETEQGTKKEPFWKKLGRAVTDYGKKIVSDE
ncbi:MAG: cell division protein FtsA [Prevotella sp.]|nr:cell division protein FtsA [Prevotella sp.]